MIAHLCRRCMIKTQKVKQRVSAVAYFMLHGEVIWVQADRTALSMLSRVNLRGNKIVVRLCKQAYRWIFHRADRCLEKRLSAHLQTAALHTET